jgi:hypothetical protein
MVIRSEIFRRHHIGGAAPQLPTAGASSPPNQKELPFFTHHTLNLLRLQADLAQPVGDGYKAAKD